MKSAFTKFIMLTVFAFAVAVTVASAQDVAQLSVDLQSKKTEQRRNALKGLKNIGTPEAARAALPALKDKEAIVRATAASVVVFLPAAEAVRYLSPNLDDKSEFVRKETAYALGVTRAGEAVASLAERIRAEKNLEVKAALAVALGDVGNPAGVSTLVSILKGAPTEEYEFVRRSSARSIGRIAEKTRTGRSAETTPDNFLPEKFKEDLSSWPTANLNYFNDAGTTLVTVVQDSRESNDTKREAAYALGTIGDPNYRSVLEPLTRSEDPYLAETAREAIKRLASIKK